MSKSFSRCFATVISVSALCFACGSDQKTPESADDMQAETPTPQPDDGGTMPTGQPVNTPPDGPPPQGLNDSNGGNAKLLPAAKSEDFVSGLKKMRETVESHLQEAKSLQAELSKTASK